MWVFVEWWHLGHDEYDDGPAGHLKNISMAEVVAIGHLGNHLEEFRFGRDRSG